MILRGYQEGLFQRDPKRNLHLMFPKEVAAPKGKIAHLLRCVYGTRDAGMLWEDTYSSCLESLGFVRGLANPCCFRHSTKDLAVVVHGDDFTSLGPRADLTWFETELAKSFEVKLRGRVGEPADCLKEMRILNRVIRLTPQGLLYESDPRHAELLVRCMDVGPAFVSTPGDKLHEADQDAALNDDPLLTSLDPEPEHEDNMTYTVRLRCVHFDDHPELIPVIPYAEIYGKHPKQVNT